MSVVVSYGTGFFSCCSVRLHEIVKYINQHKKLPLHVDSSKRFACYKKENTCHDITFEYFDHYDNTKEIILNTPINYNHCYQYINYSLLNYNNISPIVKKYFSPSKQIVDIIESIEQKYRIEYNNICVLFYRGNDKATETKLPEYDDYVTHINSIIAKQPEIKFLIQSDETEFIEQMTEMFPKNSFYFKDEIRHIKKANKTVDMVFRESNPVFSKYYLAITIIMSKCKYIICGSGNCSIWIMLFRGNCNNVYQYVNSKMTQIDDGDKEWKKIAVEGDKVNVDIGARIRYGVEFRWIEQVNNVDSFIVNNAHFGGDPSPGLIKILQLYKKIE